MAKNRDFRGSATPFVLVPQNHDFLIHFCLEICAKNLFFCSHSVGSNCYKSSLPSHLAPPRHPSGVGCEIGPERIVPGPTTQKWSKMGIFVKISAAQARLSRPKLAKNRQKSRGGGVGDPRHSVRVGPHGGATCERPALKLVKNTATFV